MKKTIFKKAACAFLAVCMTVQLAACSKNSEPAMASKDNVFRAEEVAIPVRLTNINFMRSNGENIFIYGSLDDNSVDGVDEDGNDIYSWTSVTKLVIMDLNGNLVKDITISEDSSKSYEEEKEVNEYKYVQGNTIDGNGDLWLMEVVSTYNNKTYESDEKYILKKLDSNGEVVNTIDMSSIKEQAKQEYFYINSFTIDNDGNIYVCSDNSIYVLDSNIKILFTIEGDQSSDTSGSYLGGVARTNDGRVVVQGSKYTMVNNVYTNTYFFNEIDIAAKGYGKIHESNKSFNGVSDGNGEYNLIIQTETALKGYNLDTDTYTPIIDWLQSGFDTTTLQNPTVMNDGRILCATYEYQASGGGFSLDGGNMKVNILTKVDPADVPDKKVIKIACWYLDYDVKRQATKFNKENEQYQIEVTSYMEESGYNDAMTKLNNELIAGNIPDILLMNSMMPVDNYIAKGMLTDLYTYIDNDADFNREDFLPNIFDAYTTDGKLYSLVPTFSISTVVGKTSVVGDKQGWTMDEFIALADANPDKAMFSMMEKSSFVNTALYMSLDSYIDRATGKCNFDSPEFIKLLEYANKFPKELDYELYNNGEYENEQLKYRTGEILLSQNYIYYFKNIKEQEEGYFGEPITFIGFPCSNGNGSSINANLEMAIMAKAKNPEGAWEFMRYYLSDEYQNSLEYQFPTKISALDTVMAKAKEKPYYMDGDKKVEYDNQFWIGNGPITIGVNTDADNQKMLDFIKSVKTPQRYDQDLTNIITEETESFFSGQKTAAEVAGIIQNRVSTYVSESR